MNNVCVQWDNKARYTFLYLIRLGLNEAWLFNIVPVDSVFCFSKNDNSGGFLHIILCRYSSNRSFVLQSQI